MCHALRANSTILPQLAVGCHVVRAPWVASPGAVPRYATFAQLATAHLHKGGLQRAPSVQEGDTCISIPIMVAAVVKIASLCHHVRMALSGTDVAMVQAKDRAVVLGALWGSSVPCTK